MKEWLMSTLITIAVVLVLLGIKGFIFFLIILALTFAFISLIKNKIGGMTGDTLGALNEVVEVASLFLILLLL